jgi:glycosyltransferase involved in cell wall biosynthesis
MVDFSIEIITCGEKTLTDSLNSVMRQTHNSFEVVCANSSSDTSVASLLDNYSVKHQEVGPVKHLRGREMAHHLSRGKFSILMDSTRLLKEDALETLLPLIEKYSMVAIREDSAGTGFWARQAKRYRVSSEMGIDEKKLKNNIPSYILPRLYWKDLLDEVFHSMHSKMSESLYDSIGYGEHHLIFEEAILHGGSIYYHRDKSLILHFEDSKANMIFKKYRNYGIDQKVLTNLPQYKASQLNSHRRNISVIQLYNNILCFPLISLRTFAFISGLLFSKTNKVSK